MSLRSFTVRCVTKYPLLGMFCSRFCSSNRRAASRTGVRLDLYRPARSFSVTASPGRKIPVMMSRSEEHTSELQSQSNLVCRLLLEKKKKIEKRIDVHINK